MIMNFGDIFYGKAGTLPGNGVDADVDGLHKPQHDGVQQGNEKKRRIENFQNNASNNDNGSECKLGRERITCEDSPHESL
jgi:hypothetical protein